MDYQRLKVKKKFVCAGDLRNLIEIGNRENLANNEGKPSFTFKSLVKVYSMIETPSPDDNFDGISTDTDSVTHIFTIRHLKNIDVNMKHIIKFAGNYYQVLKAENVDEMQILDIIYASHKGTITKEGVNW